MKDKKSSGKENEPQVPEIKTYDLSTLPPEVASDGFPKDDSQDAFFEKLATQKTGEAAACKTVEEPNAIEPSRSGGNSWWEDSFDERAAASQAFPKNILKEKNVDISLVNRDHGMKNVSNVGDGISTGGTKAVSGKSTTPRVIAKASTKTKKEKVEAVMTSKYLEKETKMKKVEDVKKSNDLEKKAKSTRRELEYEPRKKKRKLPDISEDDLEMVPSHEAVKILFGEDRGEEMDSGEVVLGALGLEVDMEDTQALAVCPDEVAQSSQKENVEAGGDVVILSQEMQEKVTVDVAKKGQQDEKDDKPSSSKLSSKKMDPKKPSKRMNRVRVAPVKFFGTEPDRPQLGYLGDPPADDEPAADDEYDPHMEFMFGRGQGYRKEFNHIVPDEEHDDQYLLDPVEKDRRDSDLEDYSLEHLKNLPGPSGLKAKKKLKKKAGKADVSKTQWGPTQEVQTQNGTKHAIKLGHKNTQQIGKKGKYADDQLHSVSL